MAVTIKEIARLAGVSTATVSRAFSNKDYVNPKTRAEILRIAEQKGFSPRRYKQRSGSLYSSCVGVVVPDISNAYFAEVIHGIQTVMDECSAQVLVCNSSEDPGAEVRILDTLHRLNVSGIIIAPVSNAVEYNTEYLLDLNKSGIPVVLLDRDLRNSNMDGVFMNNYGGAYEAVQALIGCGHRDIAFICGPMTSTSGLDRFNAYVAAHRDNDIPIHEEYILYGDFKFESAYKLISEKIDRLSKVTAIFSSNRRMSSGCLMALAEKGIQIGRDIAFISCGKLDMGSGHISYVNYPTVDIGKECASMLIEKCAAGRKASYSARKRTTFDMELVLQGSEKYPYSR